MSVNVHETEHKFKDYQQGKWRMVTWWDFGSDRFNVELRRYHYSPNGEYSHMGIPVKLSVSSQSGDRETFEQHVIKAALATAIRIKGMNEEIAMEFEAATGYDVHVPIHLSE